MQSKLGGLGLLVAIIALVISIMGMSKEEGAGEIVYADIQKVFNDFEMKKELTSKLESELQFDKKMLDSLTYSIQLKSTSITENSPEGDITLFRNQQRFLYDKKNEFEKKAQELTGDYDNQIITRMKEYIDLYGAENKLELLIGQDNGSSNILYGDAKKDVTTELLSFINGKYQGN